MKREQTGTFKNCVTLVTVVQKTFVKDGVHLYILNKTSLDFHIVKKVRFPIESTLFWLIS